MNSIYAALDNEAKSFQAVLRNLERSHNDLIGRMRAKEAYMESLIRLNKQKNERLRQELKNQGIKVVVYRNNRHDYWDVNTISGHGLAVVEFNREWGVEFSANEMCPDGDECFEIHFGHTTRTPEETSYPDIKSFVIDEDSREDNEREAEILIYQLYDVRREQIRWYDDE